MDDAGYYAQYLGGRTDDLLYTKSETLGEALAILWGVAEGERATRLSESLPLVDYGAPVFWPWIADQPPYHNQAVWPWAQAYWVHACAKTGNEQGVLHGVSAVWRAVMMYATNKENYVADTGNWRGTQINSSNMLWCLAGNISITFKLLMGMNFEADRIVFAPVVPENLEAERTVRNFRYRNATLDITVSGYGDSIRNFSLDGQKMSEAAVPGNLEGHHTVEIEMSDSFRKDLGVNYQPACWAPLMPVVTMADGTPSFPSEPVNTDNNCGIRMLYVDGERYGINIFPHRGTDDWDNWGWTIPEKDNSFLIEVYFLYLSHNQSDCGTFSIFYETFIYTPCLDSVVFGSRCPDIQR